MRSAGRIRFLLQGAFLVAFRFLGLKGFPVCSLFVLRLLYFTAFLYLQHLHITQQPVSHMYPHDKQNDQNYEGDQKEYQLIKKVRLSEIL